MRWLFALACCMATASACGRAPQPARTAESSDGAAVAPAAPVAAPAARNPVQTEMALLHNATLASVSAVVNNSLALVAPSFETVHAARQNTVAFLAAGTYRLPRNPERAAEFEQRDEAFHVQLEKLVEAASANDAPATARQLGVVLQSCTGCHAEFRPAIAPAVAPSVTPAEAPGGSN